MFIASKAFNTRNRFSDPVIIVIYLIIHLLIKLQLDFHTHSIVCLLGIVLKNRPYRSKRKSLWRNQFLTLRFMSVIETYFFGNQSSFIAMFVGYMIFDKLFDFSYRLNYWQRKPIQMFKNIKFHSPYQN